jgi:hypothetical protein
MPTFKLSARAKKILLRILVVLVIMYDAFGGYIWWAMHQTPEKFVKVMSRMPGPVPSCFSPLKRSGCGPASGI